MVLFSAGVHSLTADKMPINIHFFRRAAGVTFLTAGITAKSMVALRFSLALIHPT